MTAAIEWFNNDELFLKQLHCGYAIQAWLAHILLGRGFSVKLPVLKVRGSIDERGDWSNDQDLVVAGKLLEVKSRDLVFNNPASFPHDTILIDTCSGYDAKTNKPDAYLCVSQRTMRLIWLPTDTREHWEERVLHDRIRNIEDTFLLAPKVLWRSGKELLEWLQQE